MTRAIRSAMRGLVGLAALAAVACADSATSSTEPERIAADGETSLVTVMNDGAASPVGRGAELIADIARPKKTGELGE